MRLEKLFAELATSQEAMRRDLNVLKQDVGKLKGKAQEDYYRTRAGGIFGRFLRNGRDVVNRVADRLYAALHDGLVTEEEVEGVLAADLL